MELFRLVLNPGLKAKKLWNATHVSNTKILLCLEVILFLKANTIKLNALNVIQSIKYP